MTWKNTRRRSGFFALLLFLEACSGSIYVPAPTASPTVVPQVAQSPEPGLVFAASESPSEIVETFSTRATGNAAPLAKIKVPPTLGGGMPFGATKSGSVWVLDPATELIDGVSQELSGATYYSPSGQPGAKIVLPAPLGATAAAADAHGYVYLAVGNEASYDSFLVDFPPCPLDGFAATLRKYAVATSGSVTQVGTLSLATPFGLCNVPALTIDAAGNLWVEESVLTATFNGLMDPPQDLRIVEYPPGATNDAPPSRTIDLKVAASYPMPATTIGIDARGNLYTLFKGTVNRMRLGSATSTTLLSEPPIGAMAVDDNGDVFAEEMPYSRNPIQIDVLFGPTGTKTGVIGGTLTGLQNTSAGIAVTR